MNAAAITRTLLAAAALLALTALLPAQPDDQPAPRAAERFIALDVYIDPAGQPLAAWQVELRADDPAARLVGVEGGEHPAYAEPPRYDPEALAQNRVIIAAFSLDEDLPDRRTRVARLHFMTTDPDLAHTAALTAAGNRDADPITAELTITPADPSPQRTRDRAEETDEGTSP